MEEVKTKKKKKLLLERMSIVAANSSLGSSSRFNLNFIQYSGITVKA